MKILILANSSSGLRHFRKELLEELIKRHIVYISVPYGDAVNDIEAIGCKVEINRFLERRGMNPLQDLKLLRYYDQLINRIQPDITLTYTIKPNIYGGIACSLLEIPYIPNITGLGDAIENSGLISIIAKCLYKKGLRKAKKVFFQNQQNCEFFLKNAIYSGDYDVLPGSGVNLKVHMLEPYPVLEPGTSIRLSVIGRIIKDKGIYEIMEASKRLNDRNIEIVLIGGCEDNYLGQIEDISKAGIIKYVGQQENIHEWYKSSHAVLHASYHEGMSNVLLEAAACGRPVIATNVPGCREAFDDGISGIAFEPKSIESLVEAVEKFLSLPYEEKVQMGLAGRKKMETFFDRSIVIDKYITTINELEREERK